MQRARKILLKPYHFLWALLSAIRYGFPARKLTVIGITGTKGKSSVAETLFTVFQNAGHTTALVGTIRFAVGEESKPNLFKMTLPGRGFVQKFLADAVKKGATHAVIEITSEAAVQYRHLFLDLNALIFTNLEPEHIESHGSLEKYVKAKLKIGRALVHSPKRPRAIIATGEGEYGARFLKLKVENKLPFRENDAQEAQVSETGVSFTYHSEHFEFPQPGRFSLLNALAVVICAEWLGVPLKTIAGGLKEVIKIPGRAERIEAGQKFPVIVDYAHTPESLRALYSAFPERKICVLGNTGGGRDRWKRPLMGQIAADACAQIILTNEDPYDEDPRAILDEMAKGMEGKAPEIIIDRREAIRAAIRKAGPGDVVLITGKGTDPYIMEAAGKKTPWSDSRVAHEELAELVKNS